MGVRNYCCCQPGRHTPGTHTSRPVGKVSFHERAPTLSSSHRAPDWDKRFCVFSFLLHAKFFQSVSQFPRSPAVGMFSLPHKAAGSLKGWSWRSLENWNPVSKMAAHSLQWNCSPRFHGLRIYIFFLIIIIIKHVSSRHLFLYCGTMGKMFCFFFMPH